MEVSMTHATKRAAIKSLLKFTSGPITAREIADRVGILEMDGTCPSTRGYIKDLIDTGHCIGSSAKGYSLLSSGKEVQEYLNSLLKRQMGISRRIEAVYKAAVKEGIL
jgi:hypothetical protein